MLRILLQTEKFDVDVAERRWKTPLHLAARHGQDKCVTVLLSRQADVHAESDGEWTPLHSACENTKDSVRTVELLLEREANLLKRTRSGETALHIAAAAGNVNVRFLLLKDGIKRTARDAFGNTPLLRAARSPHKNRDKVVKLFAPWMNLESLSKEAELAAQQFHATVVDFGKKFERKGFGERGSSVWSTSIYDLLYRKDLNDPAAPKVATAGPHTEEDGFRWIHLPANNVPWCQGLFTKHFVESGALDVDSFKALERSFNHHRAASLSLGT